MSLLTAEGLPPSKGEAAATETAAAARDGVADIAGGGAAVSAAAGRWDFAAHPSEKSASAANEIAEKVIAGIHLGALPGVWPGTLGWVPLSRLAR